MRKKENVSDFGTKIINETLHFSVNALKASFAVFLWIEWTNDRPAPGDSATSDPSRNYLAHYYASAATIDPLNFFVHGFSRHTIQSLADARLNPTHGRLLEYESFLRRHGFCDEINLILREDDKPTAVLGLFRRASFESVDIQWPAVHRFIQHGLSFHPRILRRREARELQHRYGLTVRELEVALLLKSGASNAAIADKLEIGLGTAKTHVVNVLSKLGIQRRAQVGATLSQWSA